MHVGKFHRELTMPRIFPVAINSLMDLSAVVSGHGLRKISLLLCFTLLFINPILVLSEEHDGGDRILKLGVRADAPPFSSSYVVKRDDVDQTNYSGFSVALCDLIADRAIDSGLFREKAYIPITTEDRFEKLRKGEIHLLCGASTITLERMRSVDFTLLTFLSGASVMYRQPDRIAKQTTYDMPRDFRVGVLMDTTTDEDALKIVRKFHGRSQVHDLMESGKPVVLRVSSHDEGLERLIHPSNDDQRFDAYLADREILLALRNRLATADKQAAGKLVISRDYFTFEPYAIGIEPRRYELRFVANSVLSEMFDWDSPGHAKSHIFSLLREYFPGKKFNKSLTDLYRIQRLPVGNPPLEPVKQ